MKYLFLISLSVFSLSVLAQEKPLPGVLDAAVSKCADGSSKVQLKMGRLARTSILTYVAKSNNQDFVVLLPDGSVELYYCAPKRTVYVNGVAKQENIPVTHYSYQLGNLKDRANCEFSDILGGNVAIRFEGSYYQTNINLRPILEVAAEQAVYKNLCSNPEDTESFKVQDAPRASAQ
jgi:hypothetical protein